MPKISINERQFQRAIKKLEKQYSKEAKDKLYRDQVGFHNITEAYNSLSKQNESTKRRGNITK